MNSFQGQNQYDNVPFSPAKSVLIPIYSKIIVSNKSVSVLFLVSNHRGPLRGNGVTLESYIRAAKFYTDSMLIVMFECHRFYY